MTQCPTCGQKQGSSSKVVFWVVGLCAAFFLAFPVMIIVVLAAIAAVGTEANHEFESVASQLEAQQLTTEETPWNTPLTNETPNTGVEATP